MSINKYLELTRNNVLLEQIVVVDGQAGSGKSMFTSILPTFERVELYNYCTELENLCALYALNKIPKDSCETMIKIQLDITIYETTNKYLIEKSFDTCKLTSWREFYKEDISK